jgi:hypothetical protein
MGARFDLDPIAEDFPNGCDADHHWIQWHATDEPECVCVILHFQVGATVVASLKLSIYPTDITRAGGTEANFNTLRTKAANSSDTDDVVEFIADAEWGRNLIWARFRKYQGGE